MCSNRLADLVAAGRGLAFLSPLRLATAPALLRSHLPSVGSSLVAPVRGSRPSRAFPPRDRAC